MRTGRGLAGGLRQPGRGQAAEHQRDAAGAVEEIDERVADVVWLPLRVPGAGVEGQSQIEIDVVGVVAERGLEPRGQIGVGQRAEWPVTLPAVRMVYCLAT